MRSHTLSCASLMLALAGCGPSGNDAGPGAVTVSEARALDEAAEMLEEQRTPAQEPASDTDGEETTQ